MKKALQRITEAMNVHVEEKPAGTIGDLDKRDDLTLVTDSQDMQAIFDYLGQDMPDYDGFLVKIENGEYAEIYGFAGAVPELWKPVTQITRVMTHAKPETPTWESKVSEAIDKMEYSEIWHWGNKISGGYGLWGSHELLDSANPKEMVRAWVDALRELGYSDVDIVFYGDWKIARHIADTIQPSTTYDQFKRQVMKDADKNVEMVHEENRSHYRDQVKEVEGYMGIHGDAEDAPENA